VDGLINSCPLLDYVAEIAKPGAFQLVDVGCSGGIDRQWRRLGRGLHAIGIDADVAEIQRLRAAERNPGVTYLNAFAGIAPDHPIAIKKKGKPDLERNPWPRLSTARYMEIAYPKDKEVTDKEKRSANLWPEGRLADPESPVIVPEYLKTEGIASLDFLKIDVDGKDFDILQTFDQTLTELKVLGVGIEVRFWGSHEETDGAFHNVDRFLKAQGFELFNLSIRRYSTAALPSRFSGRAPGATEMGRVHQGDAMYARDLGSGLYDEFAKRLTGEKVLNLAAIFAAFDLPDCAVEVALKLRSALAPVCDVDKVLDLLAAQAQRRGTARAGDYREWIEDFERRPRGFLGTKNPLVRAGRAWKKGYLKWRGRMQLLEREREGS
jgi:Methyltransferase FkbM domain